MLSTHAFFPAACIRIIEEPFILPEEMNLKVERLWQAEQQRRQKPLFNGQILSAVTISSEQILGRIVEYRHLIAQQVCPALFNALQIRPVAVSGLLICADGIVFGKRTNTVTQDAGLWELVPSGGIDASKIIQGELNYRTQILDELTEETGIPRDLVSNINPFCLINNTSSHVIEIALSMTSMLSKEMVLRVHKEQATKEYDELKIISIAELEAFMSDDAVRLVDVSAMLIKVFFHIEKTGERNKKTTSIVSDQSF